MNKRITLFIFFHCFVFTSQVNAQSKQALRIEPANWWVGMNSPDLQLIVNAVDIKSYEPSINYPGVSIERKHEFSSKNYLALDLKISPQTKAGKFDIVFKNGKKTIKQPYTLLDREKTSVAQGLNESDFIYLLMPDRFSNGDVKNDSFLNMYQTRVFRDSMFQRHGGDIQGVINKLDYLQDLGVTALWLNPVQENNEHKESYHGYAITNHYQIDPRLGNNALYRKLSDELHKRNQKLIMDIVPNHIGDKHHIFLDIPDSNWFNWWPSFTRTNYRATIVHDEYSAESDKKRFTDGWFDRHMPDLNQRNPFVAKYLTQSYIWWVEYARLDAFRIDTYAYPDQNYLSNMAVELKNEYPNLVMFAEIWDHRVTTQAYFTTKYKYRGRFDSHLTSVVDFQTCFSIIDAVTKPQTWTDGLSRLYYTLADDYLYENPNLNVNFLDNHDVSRIFSLVGEDLNKWKAAIAMMMTMRGMPSIYYGTEILMKNYADPDGKVRSDFPGGWSKDPVNKFDASGRNVQENEAFDYMKNLANWRKSNITVQKGKFKHYVPEKQFYVYGRQTENETILVVCNLSDKAKTFNSKDYEELVKGQSTGKSVISHQPVKLSAFDVLPMTVEIIEIKH